MTLTIDKIVQGTLIDQSTFNKLLSEANDVLLRDEYYKGDGDKRIIKKFAEEGDFIREVDIIEIDASTQSDKENDDEEGHKYFIVDYVQKW